jgi:hypothetical protein
MGRRCILGERAASTTYQKGIILERGGGRDATASNIIEDEGASPGANVCTLSANAPQAAHLHTEEPCTGKAAIMMATDAKKIYIPSWKYTIISAP